MAKERKFDGIWNAERILASYTWFADEDGFIQNTESYEVSSYKIKQQRFIAALKAYGKDAKWFYRKDEPFSDLNCSSLLLGKTRSPEKMNEFRQLIKEHLKHDFQKEFVDSPEFLKHEEFELKLFFETLFKYRKGLLNISMMWSGMLECSKTIGMFYDATTSLCRQYINPFDHIICRMLLLLMGDDYDKSFTEKELFAFGYPDVTDDEIYQMDMDI